MAIFDRFKRKKKVILPEEVNQYYQSQKRERVGVAVLLAIVALLVTVAVLIGLFFGGRWVYRSVTDNDKKDEPKTGQNEPASDFEKPADSAPDNSQDSGDDTEVTPAPNSSPATNPTPSTPPLGDAPLPRTGDEGM